MRRKIRTGYIFDIFSQLGKNEYLQVVLLKGKEYNIRNSRIN